MSVAGLCEICESETVVDGCDRCGRVVCGDHYDRETGLCTSCFAEVGRTRGDRDTEDAPDGIDEYQF